MSGLEWVLWIILATFYFVCLFTVCLITFKKGYVGLGIIGIFLPFLWLVGAVLPAKPGSAYDVASRRPPAEA
ncbi:MAG: hypothetical protein ACRDYU_01790 [Actinomycetes bacterium]